MLDFDEDSCMLERNALRESRKERRGAVAARSEGITINNLLFGTELYWVAFA